MQLINHFVIYFMYSTAAAEIIKIKAGNSI